MKHIVAITGGIGSGKSTVAEQFASFGIPVYNSDHAAKRLMRDSEVLKNQIIGLLGSQSYHADGSLDRKYLSTQIFSNKDKRDALNSLVHPAVRLDFDLWVASYEADASVPFLLYESALVFENQMQDLFFAVILVIAPLENRISRIQKRDGRAREEILNIINAQSQILDINNSKVIVLDNDKLSNTLLKSKEIHINLINKINNIH